MLPLLSFCLLPSNLLLCLFSLSLFLPLSASLPASFSTSSYASFPCLLSCLLSLSLIFISLTELSLSLFLSPSPFSRRLPTVRAAHAPATLCRLPAAWQRQQSAGSASQAHVPRAQCDHLKHSPSGLVCTVSGRSRRCLASATSQWNTLCLGRCHAHIYTQAQWQLQQLHAGHVLQHLAGSPTRGLRQSTALKGTSTCASFFSL